MDKQKIKHLVLSLKEELDNLPNGGIGMAIGVSNMTSKIEQILKELDL